MSFDSEDFEIYYIAEENDDSHLHRSVNTLIDDDRADLYADNSLANEEWTAK